MDEPRPPSWLAYAAPNVLSGFRLAIAIAFPGLPDAWRIGAVIAAAASDGVDGYIARRLHATSWQGGLLDAVADKLTVVIVYGVFAWEGRLAAWWLAPLLARDVIVGLIAAYAALRRDWAAFTRMTPAPLGKVTTAAHFAVMLVVLLSPSATIWVVGVAGALSVLAGLDYVRRFLVAVRNRPDPACAAVQGGSP